jgi:hypothetical protein
MHFGIMKILKCYWCPPTNVKVSKNPLTILHTPKKVDNNIEIKYLKNNVAICQIL